MTGHPTSRRRLIIIAVALILAALTLLAEVLPGYLAYADKPNKADVVVLFIGRDYRARMKEARTLISEGYADRLIIPAYGQLLGKKEVTSGNGNGQEKPTPVIDLDKLEDDVRKMRARSPHYKSYFENTHVEVLEAKRIMDRHGFKSALFVSSPYHMRRIRIIVEDAFDHASYHIAFISARYKQEQKVLGNFILSRIVSIAHECIKILWFKAYRLWPIYSCG